MRNVQRAGRYYNAGMSYIEQKPYVFNFNEICLGTGKPFEIFSQICKMWIMQIHITLLKTLTAHINIAKVLQCQKLESQ